ncbi:hypothetical protein [Bacillus mojavensis]
MDELEKLIREFLHYQALTGKPAMVSMTTEYSEKIIGLGLKEYNLEVTYDEQGICSKIAGIPYIINDTQPDDFTIIAEESFKGGS